MADEISVELLTALWETIIPYVVQLFRACIRLEIYPSCFKLTEVVFLQKRGREIPTVKAWRPKAFISCLEKGLERATAKRMSHLAIFNKIVISQQFNFLSKRAATDLVPYMVHDIEGALSQR